ncbi:MAG: metallophosphoesterase [Clostridium sp.]
MIKRAKKIMIILLTLTVVLSASAGAFAADNDGWTEASKTAAADNGEWEKWCEEWEEIKNNPTQISLTPGRDETELNFSWYSKKSNEKPRFKFGKRSDLKDGKEINVITEEAVSGYTSNKCIVTGLTENTTYYYSYTIDGKWTEPVSYRSRNANEFDVLFVGDPQIGSSSANIATGEEAEQGQDKATRNDSFNWNNTINTALKDNPTISFMISAGDQIQSRDKKNPSKTYDKNEIEYAGYLSADALKSLPVATTIGNHDALSGNYSYHFNNPNVSELGQTLAGGNYYYTYGNTLFMVLNTNNYNIAEHKDFIEKAVSENKDAKWKVITLHQDIYGSGEHSNEPEIVSLRYSLVPIFEDNDIDVVLTGHDHAYSRSHILSGGYKEKDTSKLLSEDDFEKYFDGEAEYDDKYEEYLKYVEDRKAVEATAGDVNNVVDPEGILYMTANSASGSKYYDLVTRKQSYIASRWQEDVPTYSTIHISDTEFSISTYRTDNGEKIDDTFKITKTK